MESNDQVELDIKKKNLDLSYGKKVHPWRICPLGKHFVRIYTVHIPPSKRHPNGIVTTRHQHCANNSSKKDILFFDEIIAVGSKYFSILSGPPAAKVLTAEFPRADDYDQLIRGWVSYWNDIFQEKEPLNPNLIKALIASESSFDPNPKKIKGAHGLLQIQDKTLHILSDFKGELKDHLVYLSSKDLLNPSANICAGIRWLFRKKTTASAKLGHEATWEEAVIDYKGYWDSIKDVETSKGLINFRDFYNRLQEKNENKKTF